LSVTCDRSVVFSTNKTDCHDTTITKAILLILFLDWKHTLPLQNWF